MVDYKNWIPRGMLAASGGGALVALVGVVICKMSGAVQGIRLCALILFGVLFVAFGLFFLWAAFAYRAFSYRGRQHLSKDIVEGVAAYVQLPQDGLGLDVGCGSGILSIALAKLGCVTDACDTDEQAVQSSQKNAELNGVKFNQIWTGSVANLDKKYDVVVANIIADVILMLKNDLINLLKEGSYLVLAGVLDKYETRILEAFSSLKPVESQTKNEWKSFVFQKA